MRFEKTVLLDCPVEKAFGIASDFEGWPKWLAGIKELKITSKKKKGVGVVWREILKTDQGDVLIDDEVVGWEENRKIVWRNIKTGFRDQKLTLGLEFAPRQGRTRATFWIEFEPSRGSDTKQLTADFNGVVKGFAEELKKIPSM